METQSIILKIPSIGDANFITELFTEPDIKRFYRVTDELDGNSKGIIDFWADETHRNLGQTWIIHKKKTGLLGKLQKTKPCGIVGFNFHQTRKKARVSYALIKDYRGHGTMQEAVSLVEQHLKGIGVEVLEADISQENHSSLKLINKNGFTRGKTALMDADLQRRGIYEIRHVWRKRILSFRPETDTEFYGRLRIETIKPTFDEYMEIVEQEEPQPVLKARLYYLNGLLEYKACDNHAAFNNFRHSESLASNHNTLYWMARTSEHLGEYEDAVRYCNMSLLVYEEMYGTAARADIIDLMDQAGEEF